MTVTPNKVSVTGIADSVVATGTVAAPGASGSLASTVTLPRGVYTIRVLTQQSGTVDAINNNRNINLFKGGTLIVALRSLSTECDVEVPRVTMTGAQALSAIAVGAAGAGSVYHIEIVATQVE